MQLDAKGSSLPSLFPEKLPHAIAWICECHISKNGVEVFNDVFPRFVLNYSSVLVEAAEVEGRSHCWEANEWGVARGWRQLEIFLTREMHEHRELEFNVEQKKAAYLLQVAEHE